MRRIVFQDAAASAEERDDVDTTTSEGGRERERERERERVRDDCCCSRQRGIWAGLYNWESLPNWSD
jgi:hypothetical protein